MNIYDINTCKSQKNDKYIDFYDKIDENIRENTSEKDKVFLISNMDDKKFNKLNLPDYTYQHYFGDITGRNEWRDFNKCYVIHNPQFRFYTYVLKYLYYSNLTNVKKFDNRSSWDMYNDKDYKTGNIVYRFKNKEFEKLRVTTIASEIYQGIKRINRDNEHNAVVNLFNNDSKITELVKRQFKGIVPKEFDFEVERVERTYNNENREENAQYSKLIYLFEEVKPGKYSKKYFRDRIDMTNPNHFGRLLKEDKVLRYLDNNKDRIIINNKHIIKYPNTTVC